MEQNIGAQEPTTKQRLEEVVQYAHGDQDILAVLLFGSTARGEQHAASDLDVCLVLQPGAYQQFALTEKRLQYLAAFPLVDVQIFQELPLYIRRRILKEGHVLFCRDDDALYTLALRTVQAFEDFQPLYQRYLEAILCPGRGTRPQA